jgi:multidrug resistance efflux pump
MTHRLVAAFTALTLTAAAGPACTGNGVPPDLAAGYVEATDVRVAARTAGRVATVTAVEGARVEAGTVLVTRATT